MKISFAEPSLPGSGALAVLALKGPILSPLAEQVDKVSGGALRRLIKSENFKGNKGQMIDLAAPHGTDLSRVLLVGLGDAKDVDDLAIERAAGAVTARVVRSKDKELAFAVESLKGLKPAAGHLAIRAAFAARLRAYKFDKYRTKQKPEEKSALGRTTILVKGAAKARRDYAALDKVADGVFFTRDLVYEPANVLFPQKFATECRRLSRLGCKVSVMGEKRLEALGMGALLGVGQGSARESQVVVMEWNGTRKKASRPVALVGKGVTFDTGGISLKPPAGMEMMKWDMGGAGAVVGTMMALAGRKAKAHVVGIIGLVENMPSSTAQRPGDVVTSMSGQTIEVINTDAEGRLVLADVLTYVQQKYKPEAIIDLATLTGAIMIALGNEYGGLFSNNDKLSDQLLKAGTEEEEKLWRFPLHENFDKMLNSHIADMKNVGTGGKGGSITAAQFLKRFIENDTPWAHLDIAGMAWSDKDLHASPKGGTGYGVRLLNRFIADNYE